MSELASPLSDFDPARDVLSIEVLDPGSAGDALVVELVLDADPAFAFPVTLVRLRLTGPTLDGGMIRTVGRLRGVYPEDFKPSSVAFSVRPPKT